MKGFRMHAITACTVVAAGSIVHAVAGSDDGRVFYSLDGGREWDEATWGGVLAESVLHAAVTVDEDDRNNDAIELDTAAGFSLWNRIEIQDGAETELVTIQNVNGNLLTVSDLQCNYGAGVACVNIRPGRVESAFAPSDPSRMYASMNVGSGTIWRSPEDGLAWEFVSNTNADYLGGQGG